MHSSLAARLRGAFDRTRAAFVRLHAVGFAAPRNGERRRPGVSGPGQA